MMLTSRLSHDTLNVIIFPVSESKLSKFLRLISEIWLNGSEAKQIPTQTNQMWLSNIQTGKGWLSICYIFTMHVLYVGDGFQVSKQISTG